VQQSLLGLSATTGPSQDLNLKTLLGTHLPIRLAGLDLSANRSCTKSDRAVPIISKKGKSELRYALYQAAKTASSLTPFFRGYYNRLLNGRQKKGISTKMRVKLSVKLLVIAWALMKKKEPFDPVHIAI
jgi:transposase